MDTIDAIIQDRTDNAGDGRASFVSKIVAMVTSAVIWLEKRVDKRRSRLALLELTDDQLKDIGISRADAHREGLRSFFD
ncbi:DUF1127 domain-containing protein [Mesorhizobium sp. 1B3]|uniref:DUF1127 domain-containing protein n=1 Tax=Mesorhizobium sp. 1B3 TaxID=3243599 RepID=UPI003D978BA3